MRGLKTKEVCKQIKASKHSMMWSLSEGNHIITNRHWMITFEELPRDILITLFSIFAKLPNEGKTLSVDFMGEITEKELIDFSKIIDSVKQNKIPGKVTPFIQDIGDAILRLIATEDRLIYVNDRFIKMVDESVHPKCSGPMQSIYFEECRLILLPYRVPNEDSIREISKIFK